MKASQPVTDCPLRDEAFSLDSPLIDILLSPRARAVAEQALGLSFENLPAQFAGTQAPSFAAILTIRTAASMLGKRDDASLTRAEEALHELPVTDADRMARCARYDNDPLDVALPVGPRRILLFEKINGFRDDPSVDAAHQALMRMAGQKGWAMVATDRGGAITPETLSQFDAVIWNNISGDVLTLSQRDALRSYVEGGGGFVAIHGSGGDPVYFWDWYADELLGARFQGHPMKPQYQDARIVTEAEDHPVAADLPREWVMSDEWYSFRNNPRDSGSKIIATLDESTYSPVGYGGQDLRMGDHPIVWTRNVGKGRMLYSAIGHRPETYDHPVYLTMLEDAVEWASSTRDSAEAVQ
ncbi:ThuA domain-containing protein [Novosphingobium pentaromativorans]|nr:ThuA domain-containing protein [Novosphingobium pentaromativorans]